jgi:hypothetical protein
MTSNHDPIFAKLSRASAPPLPLALRERALVIARTNLPPRGKRPRSLAFADYMPPLPLVPSLLISAAAAFIVDVFLKAARFFWTS